MSSYILAVLFQNHKSTNTYRCSPYFSLPEAISSFCHSLRDFSNSTQAPKFKHMISIVVSIFLRILSGTQGPPRLSKKRSNHPDFPKNAPTGSRSENGSENQMFVWRHRKFRELLREWVFYSESFPDNPNLLN